MNDALLLKVLWRFHQRPSDLWAQVLRGKYYRRDSDEMKLVDTQNDSNLLRDIVKLQDWFQDNVEVITPTEAGQEEILLWKRSGNGVFSTACAYSCLRQEAGANHEGVWSYIWKLKIPERVGKFIWMATHNRLTTKRVISKWSGGSGQCDLCNLACEDQSHALRDNPNAKSVWMKLVPRKRARRFFTGNIRKWLEKNIQSRGKEEEERRWPEVFAVGCWFIWKWRNMFSHDQNFIKPNNAAEAIRKYLQSYYARWDGELAEKNEERIVMISWTPPTKGWCKLNTDGMSKVWKKCMDGWVWRSHQRRLWRMVTRLLRQTGQLSRIYCRILGNN